MATHKSAKKRARQDAKRRTRNRHVRSKVRTAIKKARTAASEGDPEAALQATRQAEGLIRRAASKGIVPRQRAARQVSRLARAAARTRSS